MKKHKIFVSLSLNIIFAIILFGCGAYYEKVDGEWSYVTIDEGHGKRIFPLDADEATFEILRDSRYAKDKNYVFFKGDTISKADPLSFSLLDGGFYAKDKTHVFLRANICPNANPKTFQEIEFPYAKDDKTIYCGTIPMFVTDIEDFKVLKGSSAMSITLKEIFIEENGERYQFLDTLDIWNVTYGEGRARTSTQYFEGYKQVDKN